MLAGFSAFNIHTSQSAAIDKITATYACHDDGDGDGCQTYTVRKSKHPYVCHSVGDCNGM